MDAVRILTLLTMLRARCSVERFCAQSQKGQADRPPSEAGRPTGPNPSRLPRFPSEPFDEARARNKTFRAARQALASAASRPVLLRALTGILVSLIAPHASTAGEVVIFEGSAPKPTELARILWPDQSRTRSLRLANAPTAEPAAKSGPDGFGLLIRFALNSADVLPESRPYLDSVGEMLSLPEAQGRRILIVGHTDASGPASYNLVLSERRAAAVRAYLGENFSYDADRFEVVGEGERMPLPGVSPYNARNRRVEFRAAD
jgi:outer membrane protein OmpA-like peptidoglycan-associated protein